MSGYTMTKSTMERYDIRLSNENSWRCTWATISISDDGFFNAQTDCGDFSYNWGAFGESFKGFLTTINSDYLYNKISSNEEKIDMNGIEKQLKSILLEQRTSGEIDEANARSAWEEIKELVSECHGSSPEAFHYAFSSKTSLNESITDIYEWLDITYQDDSDALTFCEVVMPIFVEILKSELAEKVG